MNSNYSFFNINKLALIGAILTLMGDFIDLLITYREFCESLNEKNNK